MAISVFHYPFYNKLGGLIQMLFRLLALAPALRLRLPLRSPGPAAPPVPPPAAAGPCPGSAASDRTCFKSSVPFRSASRTNWRASASAAALLCLLACSVSVTCLIASMDISRHPPSCKVLQQIPENTICRKPSQKNRFSEFSAFPSNRCCFFPHSLLRLPV